MTYTTGARFHATVIGGLTVSWVSNWSDDAGIHAIIDPDSKREPRRVLRNGTVEALNDGKPGLTVYGRWASDRPTLDAVRTLTPEYAALMDALEAGEGITASNDDYLDLRGVAAYLGVEYQTARRYHAGGKFGEPDVMVGRSPRWSSGSIDAARAAWPGKGARTDLV